MVSSPETGSDPPIGSDRESGHDSDAPIPEGPIDHHQPAETCESHIMRPIHE